MEVEISDSGDFDDKEKRNQIITVYWVFNIISNIYGNIYDLKRN